MTPLRITLMTFTFLALLLPASGFAFKTGDSLVPFKARAMSGEMVNIEEIVKKKPVMLFFWASW